VLGQIYGDHCDPIPAGLLAELPRAGAVSEPGLSAHWAIGTRVVHPLRGGGRVLKIDLDDPQDRPIHVIFDDGEVHHYSLASAAAKLEQVEQTWVRTSSVKHVFASEMESESMARKVLTCRLYNACVCVQPQAGRGGMCVCMRKCMHMGVARLDRQVGGEGVSGREGWT
jgi:hypothetical protein